MHLLVSMQVELHFTMGLRNHSKSILGESLTTISIRYLLNGTSRFIQLFSVRAVLYSFIGAITFNIISLILSVVYLFIGFKGDECPMIDGFVGL